MILVYSLLQNFVQSVMGYMETGGDSMNAQAWARRKWKKKRKKMKYFWKHR